MADEDQKSKKPTAEPRFMPSQAEGEREPEECVEHLRTPSQAEGKTEDVEETLRAKEDKPTQ